MGLNKKFLTLFFISKPALEWGGGVRAMGSGKPIGPAKAGGVGGAVPATESASMIHVPKYIIAEIDEGETIEILDIFDNEKDAIEAFNYTVKDYRQLGLEQKIALYVLKQVEVRTR